MSQDLWKLASDTDDQVRLYKVTLKIMPSAMPSSLPYYKDRRSIDDKRWQDLESQATMSSPGKAYTPEIGTEMETVSKLEDLDYVEVYSTLWICSLLDWI